MELDLLGPGLGVFACTAGATCMLLVVVESTGMGTTGRGAIWSSKTAKKLRSSCPFQKRARTVAWDTAWRRHEPVSASKGHLQ